MKELCRMLFEAYNDGRLAILMRLDEEAMNVTGLSQALGLTTQEASRHHPRPYPDWAEQEEGTH